MNRSVIQGAKENQEVLLGLEDNLVKEKNDLNEKNKILNEKIKKLNEEEENEAEGEENDSDSSEEEENPTDNFLSELEQPEVYFEPLDDEEDLLSKAIDNFEQSQIEDQTPKTQNSQSDSNSKSRTQKSQGTLKRFEKRLGDLTAERDLLKEEIELIRTRDRESLSGLIHSFETKDEKTLKNEILQIVEDSDLDVEEKSKLASLPFDETQKALLLAQIKNLKSRVRILEKSNDIVSSVIDDEYKSRGGSPMKEYGRYSIHKSNQSYDAEVLNEQLENLKEKNSKLEGEKKSMQARIESLRKELERKFKLKSSAQVPKEVENEEKENLIEELGLEIKRLKEENLNLKRNEDSFKENSLELLKKDSDSIRLSRDMENVEEVDLIKSSI